MKKTMMLLCSAFLVFGCTQEKITLTKAERDLINSTEELMRVLTITSRDDSLLLRRPCRSFNSADINSEEYTLLAKKMVATLVSPEQDGVGIAGPQVGIGRRIIAVMRYDKDGKPIEVYANPRIVESRGEKEPGPEGCLSVPDMRGTVSRYQDITISYTALDSEGRTCEITEDVKGYSAVIFQHEIDHLDGVLYIDKLENEIQ